jgi:hypothetical protein
VGGVEGFVCNMLINRACRALSCCCRMTIIKKTNRTDTKNATPVHISGGLTLGGVTVHSGRCGLGWGAGTGT